MWFWTMSRSAPGAVVIIAAAFQPDRLGDGDLDMVDVRAVPQRLEHQVGEAQREQVLHRLLAEIMVDAEDPLLGEGGGDRVVDLAAGGEVGAERLFERHADVARRRGRRPASPSIVGSNRVGAVDRKIASPSHGSPIFLRERGEARRLGRMSSGE